MRDYIIKFNNFESFVAAQKIMAGNYYLGYRDFLFIFNSLEDRESFYSVLEGTNIGGFCKV